MKIVFTIYKRGSLKIMKGEVKEIYSVRELKKKNTKKNSTLLYIFLYYFNRRIFCQPLKHLISQPKIPILLYIRYLQLYNIAHRIHYLNIYLARKNLQEVLQNPQIFIFSCFYCCFKCNCVFAFNCDFLFLLQRGMNFLFFFFLILIFHSEFKFFSLLNPLA